MRNQDRHAGSQVLRWLDAFGFRLFWLGGSWLFRAYFGLHALRVPRLCGPVILAPNHCSLLDPVVVGASVRRRLVFVMTMAFWRIGWLNWFFRWMRTIPVEEDRSNRSMMERTLAALRAGEAVVIFPEGGISRDGCLQPGSPGVAALILRARVPVIPVAIDGTFSALPRHGRIPRPATIRVRFGEPIPPERWERLRAKDRKSALRAATEDVMTEIARLLAMDQPAGTCGPTRAGTGPQRIS